MLMNRFRPAYFVIAAIVAALGLALQIEMVAGTRIDLNLRHLVPGGGLPVASHCGLFRTAA
jgi:hypothetical protein